MHNISSLDLRHWIEDGRDFCLIDVREPAEHAVRNIGGTNIPLGELNQRKTEIPKDRTIVVYCEKGIRSVIAIQRLEESGFGELYNLSGGIKSWFQDI